MKFGDGVECALELQAGRLIIDYSIFDTRFLIPFLVLSSDFHLQLASCPVGSFPLLVISLWIFSSRFTYRIFFFSLAPPLLGDVID